VLTRKRAAAPALTGPFDDSAHDMAIREAPLLRQKLIDRRPLRPNGIKALRVPSLGLALDLRCRKTPSHGIFPTLDYTVSQPAVLLLAFRRYCRRNPPPGLSEILARRARQRKATVAIDGTTLEANAAMRSIVRRDTGESYQEFLTGLAQRIAVPMILPKCNACADVRSACSGCLSSQSKITTFPAAKR
jgi:hypothetical protein